MNAKKAAQRFLEWWDAHQDADEAAYCAEAHRLQVAYEVICADFMKALDEVLEEQQAMAELEIDLGKVEDAALEISALFETEPDIADEEYADRCQFILERRFPIFRVEGSAAAARQGELSEAIFEAIGRILGALRTSAAA
jgi:hypothetical protein